MERAIIQEPDLSALSSADANAVRLAITGQKVTVGFFSNPSCHQAATHESDFVNYYDYQPPAQLYYNEREPDLTIDGDVATVTKQINGYDFDGALTMLGTFSVTATQAALDQQYARHKPTKRVHVPAEQRLPVPVTWEVNGTVSGTPIATTYTGNYIVGHYFY